MRDFVFDSADELAKIIAETGGDGSGDRGLVVRLAVRKGGAYDLTGKFGASPETTVAAAARRRGRTRRGSAYRFHVGSQCLDPQAYAAAMARGRRQ